MFGFRTFTVRIAFFCTIIFIKINTTHILFTQNVLATFDENEENKKEGEAANVEADDDCKSDAALSQLTFEHNGHAIKLDDLQLTFQYSPSSTIFGLDQVKVGPF